MSQQGRNFRFQNREEKKTNGTLEEKHTTIISAFCLHKLDISNFFILKIKEKNRNRFIKEDQKMCEV